MMSPSLSVALVIDAAAETPAELLEAVQTGATDFLLRLPEGARTAVVTSGGDPRIAAPLSAERADALSALSALRPTGLSSTAEAALLAADELTTAPEGPRAIVVFANSLDVGSPSVEQVTEAVSDSTALIYAIQTSKDTWWSPVVDGAGGAVLRTDLANVVQTYGDLATALEEQYLVTFQAPGELPAVAEVDTGPGESESSAVVPLPAPDTAADPAAQPDEEPADQESGPSTVMLFGLVLLGLALTVLVLTGIAIVRARQRTSAASSPVAAGIAGQAAAGTTGPPSTRSTSDVPDTVQGQDEPAGASPSPPAVVPLRRKSPRASLSAAVQGRMSAQQALSSALEQQARRRLEDEQQGQPAPADGPAVPNAPDDAVPTEAAAPTSDEQPQQAPAPATSPQPAEAPAPADESDEQRPADESEEQHQAEEDDQDAPTVLTGSGDAVIELAKPPSGPAAVRISGNQGARYFGVQTLGTDRALVMTIEPFDGVRMLDWDGGETTGFDIRASGPWRIELLPLSAMPSFDTSFEGEGSMVVRFTGDGSEAEISGNAERRYFEVQAFGTRGSHRRLVEATRPYAGVCKIAGAQYFEVQAIGTWTISVK